MAEAKRKLAAILSADVVGYSRLMHEDEAATVTTLKEYRAAIGRVIDQHSGRIVNAPGDNILAEFPSAVEAVQAGVEIQANIEGRNAELQNERRMHFRIGINLGDVLEEQDGTIYGDGVNIAARMEALADDDGGICISSSVYDAVEGKIEFGFDFLGEQQVKNIAKPINVYRVRSDTNAKTVPPEARSKRPSLQLSLLTGGGIIALATIGAVIWLGIREPGPDTAVAPAKTQVEPIESESLPIAEEPSIAVLPFSNFGGDPEQDYFADGVTEEIITALTRFPNLKVLPRNTSFQYNNQTTDIQEIGRELGAKYILEGSVRKADEMVRVTVQLLNTMDGNHLWAETYERDLSASNIFAIQDEITEQVAGMIAGTYGIISRADYEQAKRKGTNNLEAYDCVLRLYAYRSVLGEDGHGKIRVCLEQAVKTDPDYADAWTWLTFIYALEHIAGYNPQPAPLERAVNAGRRAVELDPMSGIAHASLARAYFWLGEFDLFLTEVEKSVTLNPNNSDVLGTMGYYLAFTGDSERGFALMRKAMSLSVSYPGWLHESFFWTYFSQGDYEAALAEARSQIKMMPEFGLSYALAAAAYGQLGLQEKAQLMISKLQKTDIKPEEYAPETYLKWHISEEAVDRYRKGLQVAGLELPDGPIQSQITE